MTKLKETSIFNKSIEVIFGWYAILKNTSKLFQLEWQLAKHSLRIIIGYLFFLLVLMITAGILFSLASIVTIHYLGINWLAATLITLLLNLSLILLAAIRIQCYYKYLQFPYTKKHLFGRSSNAKEEQRDEKTNAA